MLPQKYHSLVIKHKISAINWLIRPFKRLYYSSYQWDVISEPESQSC